MQRRAVEQARTSDQARAEARAGFRGPRRDRWPSQTAQCVRALNAVRFRARATRSRPAWSLRGCEVVVADTGPPHSKGARGLMAGSGHDGLLTASEVAQLKLNADWVVLSACNNVAGGKPGAEALSGLASHSDDHQADYYYLPVPPSYLISPPTHASMIHLAAIARDRPSRFAKRSRAASASGNNESPTGVGCVAGQPIRFLGGLFFARDAAVFCHLNLSYEKALTHLSHFSYDKSISEAIAPGRAGHRRYRLTIGVIPIPA
jgi:hypothetical protein